jgi:hypothetical protein
MHAAIALTALLSSTAGPVGAESGWRVPPPDPVPTSQSASAQMPLGGHWCECLFAPFYLVECYDKPPCGMRPCPACSFVAAGFGVAGGLAGGATAFALALDNVGGDYQQLELDETALLVVVGGFVGSTVGVAVGAVPATLLFGAAQLVPAAQPPE